MRSPWLAQRSQSILACCTCCLLGRKSWRVDLRRSDAYLSVMEVSEGSIELAKYSACLPYQLTMLSALFRPHNFSMSNQAKQVEFPSLPFSHCHLQEPE